MSWYIEGKPAEIRSNNSLSHWPYQERGEGCRLQFIVNERIAEGKAISRVCRRDGKQLSSRTLNLNFTLNFIEFVACTEIINK